jgi:hypothetical protein
MLAVAIAILALPLPGDMLTASLAFKVARAPREATIVVGNSAIDHVSACDSDRHTLPQMISTLSGRRVIDASYGGQEFETSLGLAGMASRLPGARTIILPVNPSTLSAPADRDRYRRAFFRIMAGSFASFGAASGSGIPGQPFSYKGRAYPDYDGIKAGHFTLEKRAARCPETIGIEPAFTEALFWNGNLRYPIASRRLADIAQLARSTAANGKRLVVVLMPFAGADATRLDRRLSGSILARYRAVALALRQASVDLVDLSNAVPSAYFSDRWCACGHLQAHGRLIAARALTSQFG